MLTRKKLTRTPARGLVRAKGLEPPHLAMAGPKPAASTSSATPASGEKRAVPLSQWLEKGKRLGFGVWNDLFNSSSLRGGEADEAIQSATQTALDASRRSQ
jgi:hypothetical protein